MDVIVIFYFGPVLAFTPLIVQKIKILKKWKKHQEISSFYVCVPWSDDVPFLKCGVQRTGGERGGEKK